MDNQNPIYDLRKRNKYDMIRRKLKEKYEKLSDLRKLRVLKYNWTCLIYIHVKVSLQFLK